MSDVKIFMKNMGGAGSDSPGYVRLPHIIRRLLEQTYICSLSMTVNTVDVLYSAFPAFIYLNPALGKYLLTPLLEYQDSPMYTLDYAARNIGTKIQLVILRISLTQIFRLCIPECDS